MNILFSRPIAITLFASAIAIAPIAFAQSTQQHNSNNHDMSQHEKMSSGDHAMPQTASGEKLPLEPGQGAFATVAEIVAMLSNDPTTDWDKVDIDGLREHLIDMDELILRANSKNALSEGKITFVVTGTGRTKQAIQAMVPAHSQVLSRTTAWDVKGEITENGANLTVTSHKPHVLKVIAALGFYGVMATGAHHQAHHLAMAKGDAFAHSHN